jgi:integrase
MPGRIVKRSRSSWTVVVDLGPHPETGKRRQLSRAIKGTKRDAEALLVQLLHDRDGGIDRPDKRVTVGDYLDRWLEDYVRLNCAPKTAQTYREIVSGHLRPAFGSMQLTALRPQAIQAFYSRALYNGRRDGRGGLSARSVLRYHQVLHAALRTAVKWQLLARNPADAVEPPRAPRRELHIADATQLGRLFAIADATPYGPLIRLAAMTGLRRGELLGVRWADVDLDGAVLHVQQSAQRISGQGIVFRQPKTNRSRRAVALSPATVAFLRQHRRRQAEARLLAGPAYQDRDLVFTSGLGGALEPGTLRRAWTRIRAEAGLPRLRLHDLRHAHATLLLSQGVHPKIVSERLGHASIAITLDTYSHVLPGLQASAAAGLDRLFEEEASASVG